MDHSSRQALLNAAAQFDSANSDSDRASVSETDSEGARRKAEKHSKRSKKRKKHSSKKDSKTHKRKRSDHEKIAELERRAAAMGTGPMLSGLQGRLGFGRRSSSMLAASAGDSVVLDTSGDASNALYESLYSGDVPRYHRIDPFDLIQVSRRLGKQQGDADIGNSTADRYYHGRHFLQERSRSTKRIHFADLTARQHREGSSSISRSSGRGTLPLPTITPLLPPNKAEAGSASIRPGLGPTARQPDQEQGVAGSRRLAIPAPAFIPLEAPEELLQQTEATAGPAAVSSSSRQPRGLDPAQLVQQAGLSQEDQLLEATRAWNAAVRERPHEEELWLGFAAFQHRVAQQQQQRSRSASLGSLDPVTAEKQISVLSRGLTHLPSSSALLLALLRAYAAVAPDGEALEAKWAAVLARQGGSWELWREFINLKQSSFADFKVSDQQKVYADAIYSLQRELLNHRRTAAAALRQKHKQLPPLSSQHQQQLTALAAAAAAAVTSAAGSSGSSGSSGLDAPLTVGEEALELQLVQLLLGLLLCELEAGYCEQALAKIQALLEFHLFPPSWPPGGVSALLRLFAAYWGAGVPRIGEQGARGWAYWCLWHAMGMEQPAAAAAAAEEQAAPAQQEQEPAGWSGWFEVPAAQQQQQQQQQQQPNSTSLAAANAADVHPAAAAAAASPSAAAGSGRSDSGSGQAAGSGDEAEDSEAAAAEEELDAAAGEEDQELDEEELMRQLGLQLEQQLAAAEQEGLPPEVLARWVHQEAACSSTQWQPLRSGSSTSTSAQPQADDSSTPDPARIARLDSVQPCLFLLRSAAALRRLVLGCLELLGVPLGGTLPWCSSNCPTPLQQLSAISPAEPAPALQSSFACSSQRRCWSDAAAEGVAGGSSATGPQQQQQQQQVPWYAVSDKRWQWAVNTLQRLVAGGPCSHWPELCHALMLLLASKPSQRPAPNSSTTAAGSTAATSGSQAAAGGDDGSDITLHTALQQLTLDGAAAESGAVSLGAVLGGGGVGRAAGSPWPSRQQLAAARGATKELLADQQDNLLLYDAYGCLEAAAGQVKTSRKVFETALGLASSATASATAAAGPTEQQAAVSSAAAAAAPLLACHLAQLELTAGGKHGLAKAHAALHALLAGQPLQAAAATGAASVSNQTPQQQHQQQQRGLLADTHLRAARVRFQQSIAALLASAGGFLTVSAASTIAAAALFELTVGLRCGDGPAGVNAAVAVCRQVSDALPLAVRAASAQHEQLAVLQCHLLVAAATGAAHGLVPGWGSAGTSSGGGSGGSSTDTVAAALMAAVSPARAREALAAALQLYPHSQGLLQLQIALDQSCCTMAGLRQQLAALTEVCPSPQLWAAALQAEAMRPGGRVRLGALFERALAAPIAAQWHQQDVWQRQRRRDAYQEALRGQEGKGEAELLQQLLLGPASAGGAAAALLDVALWDGFRGWGRCIALWQQYIQHEIGLGRGDAARRLFLRAVHAAPGSKALWLSGFGAVCAGLQPRECSGLVSAMQDREVLVRADVYGVLLEAVAERQQLDMTL